MPLTEILRPNGSGDLNTITSEVGDGEPNHYLNVDEITADDDTTMVYSNNAIHLYDLYHLTDTTIAAGHTIEKIIIHGRFKCSTNPDSVKGPKLTWKSGGQSDAHRFQVFEPGVWTDCEREHTLNPFTSAAWTAAQLDALQVGCGLMRSASLNVTYEYCTQIYVEVFYNAGEYPDPTTDPLRRASGIKRTFWAGIGGQSIYQVELVLGGLSTTYVSPIGSREPPSAVTPSPTPSGSGYQEADYLLWLKQTSWDAIVKIFGHFPTYAEWVKWRQSGGVSTLGLGPLF